MVYLVLVRLDHCILANDVENAITFSDIFNGCWPGGGIYEGAGWEALIYQKHIHR
jgi:hypothetical protein